MGRIDEFFGEPGAKFAHFSAGMLTVLACVISPVLSVIGFLTFIAYEFGQCVWLRDEPTTECLEYAYGFFIAIIFMLAIKSLGGVA